ncbi:MAG: hypothetical protein JO333_20590 [Verrucomicrobia bacterium]|nr:hypothetical protein [Verrucomicrobiota bacterium]
MLNLPTNFSGPNLPDVSFNADPESGCLLLSTEAGSLIPGFGGTSFVAPQLNGISRVGGEDFFRSKGVVPGSKDK